MDQIFPVSGQSEPPRGIIQARIDEKGRLKLPATFREYVASFGVRKVFITSLDRRLAQLYPIAIWRSNEKALENCTEDPEAAEDIAFNANDLGADCEMDDQGRVLVPKELRQELGLENQPVWLEVFKGPLNIYSQAMYEHRQQRGKTDTGRKLTYVKSKGVK